MAKALAEASVDIRANLRPLNTAIGGLATSLVGRLGSIGKGAGLALGTGITLGATAGLAGLAAAVTGGGALAALSTKLASDAEEAGSKFGFVFGKSAGETMSKLDAFSKAAGRSRYELRSMAADIGALIKPLGFMEHEVGAMSVQVTKAATDLASFFNATDAEALDALRAGIVGESEPLKRFGIIINEARIQQEALAQGFAKTKAAITPAIKAQTILAIVTKDMAAAQGDAVRTSGSFANAVRGMAGAFKDMATDVGKLFLPAATEVLKALRQLGAWMASGTGNFEKWGAMIAEVTRNVIDHITAMATAFKNFFVTQLGGIISSATGGAVQTFSQLVDEILSIAAVLTTDFDKTWKLLGTAAAFAWNEIKLSFLELVNTIKSVAQGAFSGLSQVMSDTFAAARVALEALGIDIIAIFEGVAEVVTKAIEKIKKNLTGLSGTMTKAGASIGAALGRALGKSAGGKEESEALKTFDKRRAAILGERKETINQAKSGLQAIGESFFKGFRKGFGKAQNQDDFVNRAIGDANAARGGLIDALKNQFADLRKGRDARQAEREANAPKQPKQKDPLFGDLAKRIISDLADAGLVAEDFSIGSASAPYPGAASLPARERINCRCTTSGVF